MPLPTTPAEWQKLADLVMAYGGNPKLWKDVYQGGWDPARYNKEITMTMREGPYKSTTHGPIPMSLKGRELMDGIRATAQNAIEFGDFNTHDRALSRARGDLAKYISELEAKCDAVKTEELRRGYGCTLPELSATTTYERMLKWMNTAAPLHMARFPWRSFEFHGFDESAKIKSPKENPMTDEKTTPAPKTRSELIGEATHELVQAQRALEQILAADQTPPHSTYLHDAGVMGSAIVPLVLEQWAALVKKATTRAKARVAKAEKAVASLLAG